MFENLDIETLIRLRVFLLVLAVMMIWEWFAPRRSGISRLRRWPANFGIAFLNALMLGALPVTAVAASLLSLELKFGLFIWLKVSLWPSIILSLLILDAVIYWQHRIFHMITPLWRVHRMHHSDSEFDVSTALRFHPVEILISIVLKAIVIVLLGAPILAVIAFEIILNGSAMFNHSNIRMPLLVDKIVRYMIVTPDMHRVHHSVYKDERDFNFGFCLSVWDRLFGSYVNQPKDGHEGMSIGLDIFNGKDEARLDKLLTQPFRN